jgi:ketosteroid isomerase-like protein
VGGSDKPDRLNFGETPNLLAVCSPCRSEQRATDEGTGREDDGRRERGVSMSQATETIVKRYLDGLRRRDPKQLDDVLADEFVGHLNDHDEDREQFKGAMDRFSRLTIEPTSLLLGADSAAFVHSFAVTFSESYHGSAAGRSFDVGAMTFLRVRDGKVVELWMVWDSFTSMGQLGLVESETAHDHAHG